MAVIPTPLSLRRPFPWLRLTPADLTLGVWTRLDPQSLLRVTGSALFKKLLLTATFSVV